MSSSNVHADRLEAYFRADASYSDVIFWSNPNTWMNQTTTPNHSTSYVTSFVSLKSGPANVGRVRKFSPASIRLVTTLGFDKDFVPLATMRIVSYAQTPFLRLQREGSHYGCEAKRPVRK
jgi:hypothetical protein